MQQVITNGRYVFREDVEAADRIVLRGFDLVSHSAFPVPVAAGVNLAPHSRGTLLAWYRTHGDDTDVHAAFVADVLPTAHRPSPADTSPLWIYFPETGHYLAYGFKTYWLQSGGLPVFGFPLTAATIPATATATSSGPRGEACPSPIPQWRPTPTGSVSSPPTMKPADMIQA